MLHAWGEGDPSALNALIPIVHDELRRIARACLRGERKDHSLQATALVNEAFLRLVHVERVDWQDRVHFLAMAARLMRRVLIDMAKGRRSLKRGADPIRVTFDAELLPARDPIGDLLGLDDALEALARLDERKARVVELRFFGGLSVDETATALHVSTKTVTRDWDFARAWLQRALRGGARP